MKKPRLPYLGPLAFEMFYEMSRVHKMPRRTEPCELRIHGKRVRRDYYTLIELKSGEPDTILAMLMQSKIYSRTLARHASHIRMMHHLLGELGHNVTAEVPTTDRIRKAAWRAAIQRAMKLAKQRRAG